MKQLLITIILFISVIAYSQDLYIGLGVNNTGTKPFPDVLWTRYGINGIIEYRPENLKLGTSINPSMQFAEDSTFLSIPIELKWTLGELNRFYPAAGIILRTRLSYIGFTAGIGYERMLNEKYLLGLKINYISEILYISSGVQALPINGYQVGIYFKRKIF